MTSPVPDADDALAEGAQGIEPDEPVPLDPGVAPLIAALKALWDDLVMLLHAEVQFQSSRARVVSLGLRKMAVLALAGLILAVFFLGALVVGLLLALTPLVTAWGATAIVAGGLGLAVAWCGWRGLRAWRAMRRALEGRGR